MNQQEYMDRFRAGIVVIPAKQAQKIEEEIARQFDEGRENGMGENTLSGIMGNPDELARGYVEKYKKNKWGKNNIGKRVLLSIGILIVDAVVALPVIAALIAVWILLILGIPVIIAGVLLMLCYVFIDVIPNIIFLFDYPHACFYGGIFCMSAGLAMAMSSTSFGRWVMHIAGLYLDFNMDIFAGRRGI